MALNVFQTLDEVQPTEDRAVALGLFDGVHLGHQAVIRAALDGKNQGLCPSVFTYRIQHMIPQAKKQFQWIISESDRLRRLREMGIKTVVEPTFEEFCDISPEEFVVEFLIKKMRAKLVCCGSDFKFGKKASGTVEDLVRLCKPYGVQVNIIQPVSDDKGTISSTRIRQSITDGDMSEAWDMLGRPYSVRFPVVSGNKLGRTIDFPTINQIYPDNFVIPKYGVYASITEVDGKKYASVTNVGIKPTIGKYAPRVETYIIDFKGNLYGQHILVELCRFQRPEQKFASVEELKEQISRDAEHSMALTEQFLKRMKEQ